MRTPDLTYIAVARKQQVLAVAFSVDWHVIVLLERLLQFHLLECRDALVARKRQGKRPSKSPVNLGPSARNTCSSLRVFFSSSEWIYFILFLLSIILLLLYLPQSYKYIFNKSAVEQVF